MGSSTLIDIVSSMLIGGLLLVVAIRMDEQATKNTYDSEASLTVQQNLTSLIENIEYDFRKIGYCKNPNLTTDPAMYILYGDSDSISFIADLNNVGKLDTVTWYLGGPVQGSPNPAIRMLYRKVDNNPVMGSNLGVTEFSLAYFETFGQQLPGYIGGSPDPPQLIQLTVKVEPTAAYDSSYSSNYAIWRQTRLISRNLRDR
jgi:hypothetical protein